MQVPRIKIIGCESNYIDENILENPWQQNRRALPQVSF
jgi:hypothetical protein